MAALDQAPELHAKVEDDSSNSSAPSTPRPRSPAAGPSRSVSEIKTRPALALPPAAPGMKYNRPEYTFKGNSPTARILECSMCKKQKPRDLFSANAMRKFCDIYKRDLAAKGQARFKPPAVKCQECAQVHHQYTQNLVRQCDTCHKVKPLNDDHYPKGARTNLKEATCWGCRHQHLAGHYSDDSDDEFHFGTVKPFEPDASDSDSDDAPTVANKLPPSVHTNRVSYPAPTPPTARGVLQQPPPRRHVVGAGPRQTGDARLGLHGKGSKGDGEVIAKPYSQLIGKSLNGNGSEAPRKSKLKTSGDDFIDVAMREFDSPVQQRLQHRKQQQLPGISSASSAVPSSSGKGKQK